jgi:hypothetical protein
MAAATMRELRAARLSGDEAEVITGSRLQACADVSLVPRGWRAPRQRLGRSAPRYVVTESDGRVSREQLAVLNDATVIFVFTHEIDTLLEVMWPELTPAARVLISHNSDIEIRQRHREWLDRDESSPVRWFAQNVTVEHPRLTPLPIGMANPAWPHGDLRSLALVARESRDHPKDRLVLARFDPSTYPPRAAVWEALRSSFPELDASPPGTIPFRQYLSELARHRFAICPRGNGIDTYRVWESLYLGVIPVVERSLHTTHWVSLGLPLLLVDDWHAVTPAFLEEHAERFPAPFRWPELPPALRLSTYTSMIAAARAEAAGRTVESAVRHGAPMRSR